MSKCYGRKEFGMDVDSAREGIDSIECVPDRLIFQHHRDWGRESEDEEKKMVKNDLIERSIPLVDNAHSRKASEAIRYI